MPPSPTAANSAPLHFTAVRRFVVPEVCGAHVAPSADVNTTPSRPTATRTLPLDATALKSLLDPEVRAVQTTPSGEVSIRPSPKSPPTATYGSPVQITDQRTSL